MAWHKTALIPLLLLALAGMGQAMANIRVTRKDGGQVMQNHIFYQLRLASSSFTALLTVM